MKTIYKSLIAALTAALALTGCQKQDPFYTAGEDDYPRILNSEFSTTDILTTFPSVYTSENFVFEIIVTPARYTTVEWFVDGDLVHTGNKIDQPLLAGTHKIKVVATTTKGKQTYRKASIEVLSSEGEPSVASDEKSRWLQQGKGVTVSGENLTGVSKAFLKASVFGDETSKAEISGLVELQNFVNEGGKISFNVPSDLAEGDYLLILEKEDGTQFGAGIFGVHADEYVDPGVTRTTIWEGATDINWGDSKVELTPDLFADVPVGATIVLHYKMIEADYHALRVCNFDWKKDFVAQVDAIDTKFPDSYEFTYTDEFKSYMDEGNMVITGFGYKLTSVEVVSGASSEITIWEGATDINWGDSKVELTPDLFADVPVGATIVLHYKMIEADYHALRVCNFDWKKDFVAQVDAIDTKFPDSYEFTYTDEFKSYMDEGNMVITGFGYQLTKVTVK